MKLSVNERLDTKQIKLIKSILGKNIVYISDDKAIGKWQEYIDSSYKELGLRKSIDVESVVAQASRSIVYKKFVTRTDFFINPLIIASNSSMKLIDICKLLNYGNIEMPGTYIFTKAFNLSEIEIVEMKMRGLI